MYLAAFLLLFSFPFVFVDPVSASLLDLVVNLNGRSRDFVDPRLLNLHLRPELPGSAELRKVVQQVVAAGQHARMNVEVLAHAIWTVAFASLPVVADHHHLRHDSLGIGIS